MDDFFKVPSTGVRVSLRDSKSLIEVFCEAATEGKADFPENPEL